MRIPLEGGGEAARAPDKIVNFLGALQAHLDPVHREVRQPPGPFSGDDGAVREDVDFEADGRHPFQDVEQVRPQEGFAPGDVETGLELQVIVLPPGLEHLGDLVDHPEDLLSGKLLNLGPFLVAMPAPQVAPLGEVPLDQKIVGADQGHGFVLDYFCEDDRFLPPFAKGGQGGFDICLKIPLNPPFSKGDLILPCPVLQT